MFLPYLSFCIIAFLGWVICKRKNIKNNWLRVGIALVAGVLLTNLTFRLFGKNLGAGGTGTASWQKFKLMCGEITVRASGSATGDHGSATVYVTINKGKSYKLESNFNYDLFYNDDPAIVYYAFGNLDPIVDLKIKTSNETYTISGLSGELSR